MKYILENLKQLRKANGYSQLQTADFLHIRPSTVALWENGEKTPRLGQILRLCEIFKCLPADIAASSVYFEQTEKDCCLPVFYTDISKKISFAETSALYNDIVCHFGLVMPYDLSDRIKKGDICFFELCRSYRKNDVVISVDDMGSETVFIADENCTDKNIVAVCRFMQSKF